MRIIKSASELQKLVRAYKRKGNQIGFVPTMGALHEGHASLLHRCRQENDISILSIFVNPKQFAPTEDFHKYPRTLNKDLLFAKKEKVDIIFYPSVDEMYQKGYLTDITVRTLSDVMCGASRPGHFQGVTTVVGKLLNIVNPDVLYLGQKDAQQALIISRMIKDLNFPVKLTVCPIIRERDGLALSSRNVYLSSTERSEAPILFKSLREAKSKINKGERSPKKIVQSIRANIINNSKGRIDYIVCVNGEDLSSLKVIKGSVLIALAVKFGTTRLIDNISLHI